MKVVRTLVPLFVGIVIGASVSSSVAAPADAETVLAERLLEATGAADLGKQMIGIVSSQVAQLPGVDPAFLDRAFADADTDDLVSRIVPIYTKHLDEQTLKKTVKFYESPAGKAFAAAQPAIAQDSALVGQKWGRELAERAIQKITEAKAEAEAVMPEPVEPTE